MQRSQTPTECFYRNAHGCCWGGNQHSTVDGGKPRYMLHSDGDWCNSVCGIQQTPVHSLDIDHLTTIITEVSASPSRRFK